MFECLEGNAIWANWKLASAMEKEYVTMKTVQSMKENGSMIIIMGREFIQVPLAKSNMAIGN